MEFALEQMSKPRNYFYNKIIDKYNERLFHRVNVNEWKQNSLLGFFIDDCMEEKEMFFKKRSMVLLLNLIEKKGLKIEELEYDSFVNVLMLVIRGSLLE